MTNLSQLQKQYRKLCAQAVKMDQKRVKIQKHMDALKQERSDLIQKIHDHKYLIDYCVITAHTPTQARLSRTREEIKAYVDAHFSQYASYDQFLFGSTVNLNNTITIAANPHITHTGLWSSGQLTSSNHIGSSNQTP